MIHFILSTLYLILCVVIGYLLGSFVSNYFVTKSLKDSIFKKSDFEDIDNDFFSDSSNGSITDINSSTDIDSINIDSTNNIDNKTPKFF